MPRSTGSLLVSSLALTAAILCQPDSARAQGCIAVRGGSCMMGNHHMSETDAGSYLNAGEWQTSVAYRWLHSDREFKGNQETATQDRYKNQDVNDSHFIDLNALYAINARFSIGLTIPFVSSTRSSKGEHGYSAAGDPGPYSYDKKRYSTSAGGIGDVRVAGYAWLWDPKKMPQGNLSVGLGLKLPTGDDAVTDVFHTSTAATKVGPVDQSIQPGDGGYGFTVELQGFRNLYKGLSGYAQGYYLFNPRDMNGVSTLRGSTPTPFTPPETKVMSVTDQYLARVGLSYNLVPQWGLSLSFGPRIEGVPVEDLIGDSNGFRRPGYAISVEPGLSVNKGHWSFNVTAPVAFYRTREQSLPEKQITARTGFYNQGNASFADYVITSSISYRF